MILLLALVVLGPEKLPDAVRRFSQTYNELKKMGNGFQSELRSVIDEPMREVRNTADMIRDAADPSKVDDGPTAEARADDDSDRPAVPPPAVAPPPPFASSRGLGTALPAPEGPRQPAPRPPRVNGGPVNGHRHDEVATTDAGDDVPAPPPPPAST